MNKKYNFFFFNSFHPSVSQKNIKEHLKKIIECFCLIQKSSKNFLDFNHTIIKKSQTPKL